MKLLPPYDLDVISTVPIHPHAGKVTDALSRIGYKIEEAIADLLDNSIDASASKVLIRFVHDNLEIKRIVVADNGSGMTDIQLRTAMQFGSGRDRSPGALGKFGMGLKTAALSQGRSLTVISRRSGVVSSYRWTTQSIANGWNCEVLNSKKAEALLNDIRDPFPINQNGTMIAIDELDHALTGSKGLEVTLQKLQKKLSAHLGLVFHRFLDAGAELYIDSISSKESDPGFCVPVASLNPFSYPVSGDKSYPVEFSVSLKELPTLKCRAHIWPPNQSSAGYHLNGGNVVNRQGFYFYRNDRLIQAGGWNGWRENDSDHHLSLARVEIDLPPAFDTEFRLNVQKSALDAPESFRIALSAKTCPMQAYVKRADEIYRKKTEVDQDFVPVPGEGFGSVVRRRAASYLTGKKAPQKEINVLWAKLPEDRFFDINREVGNIILNSIFRSDILNGSNSSKNDVPLVKILLFLLLRDDLLRERESKRFTDRLEEINELLMLGLKEEQKRNAT